MVGTRYEGGTNNVISKFSDTALFEYLMSGSIVRGIIAYECHNFSLCVRFSDGIQEHTGQLFSCLTSVDLWKIEHALLNTRVFDLGGDNTEEMSVS